MKFKLIPTPVILLLTTLKSSGQVNWGPVDDTSFVGTVIIHAPRVGYSYNHNHLVEIGYGIYIGREDLTIDDNRKLFLGNIKKVSHSFNLCLEYTKVGGQSVWAPRLSYVIGFFLLAARGDLVWQTTNLDQGYFNTRVGLGIGLYNVGIFAMKELNLNNGNPYRQNWGVSFTTFIWGGTQKYISKKK
jgi:hypothetical protein